MLLSDADIRNALLYGNLRIKDSQGVSWSPQNSDIYDPGSSGAAVQAASIDLSIGRIFVPTGQKGKPGRPSKEFAEIVLEPGETAVVEIAEEVELPADIGGILIPIHSVAAVGLLLLNPGHIDPGYKGKLEATLINMSSVAIPLSRGRKIATVLLFLLQTSCAGSWKHRNPNAPTFNEDSSVERTAITSLSHDFLDVQNRAKREAKRQVFSATWRITALLVFLTLGGVVAANYFQTHSSNSDRVNDLRREVAVMQQQLADIEHQVSSSPTVESRHEGR